jgi:hypothetical protein
MSGGQFPEPNFPHAIPDDDFAHTESMDCPCGPYAHGVVGIGGAVCHRAIRAEPLPDTLPEEWEE